jgi:2-keto-4-pentenoate hydratase/2-oxohepta-3-ene-1,7-dioic acid hydratase in catechol pathway
MKFASYEKDGQATFGALVDGGLANLAGRLSGVATLKAALAAGGLSELSRIARSVKPDVAIDQVTFLPVVPDSDKIIGVGLNYAAHAAESGREASKEFPVLFFRLGLTVLGHGASLQRPKASTHYDFEGELAVVIGRGGRHIQANDAMAHVGGYSCFMDGSVRDFQKRSLPAGKNFEATGAWGPFLTTADEVPDPSKLALTTRLNGDPVQHSTVDNLIHSIPELIACCSQLVSLAPGDVIATGTPAGVGQSRQPPLWLKAGDVVTVDIPGVGTLVNPIADEA